MNHALSPPITALTVDVTPHSTTRHRTNNPHPTLSTTPHLVPLTVASLPDSPQVQRLFETAASSPASSLSTPVHSPTTVIHGKTPLDDRRIAALQRELRDSELQLQQAGRLGIQLHHQNDRLTKGIEHLQEENDRRHDSTPAMVGLPTTTPHPTPVDEYMKAQNNLLQSRNQNLNLHCEEADQKIEDLIQQIHRLELELRKERAITLAQAKHDAEQAYADSQASSPRTPRTPGTPGTSLAQERVPYEGTHHTNTITIDAIEHAISATLSVPTPRNIQTMTLDERVNSFLETSTTPLGTPQGTPRGTPRGTLLSTPLGTPTASISSMLLLSNAARQEDAMQATIEDKHRETIRLQQQINTGQKEIDCERALRVGLEQECQSYHEASVQHADEASALSQRMRLAELARQSADTQLRHVQVQLRTLMLEKNNNAKHVVEAMRGEYNRKLVVLQGAKKAAEARADSFQQQAIDTLKQLMKMNQEEERVVHQGREEVLLLEEEGSVGLQEEKGLGGAGGAEGTGRGTNASLWLPVSPMLPTPPTDYGYGMKLKRLQEEYVKAGKKGHGIFPACVLGGEEFLEQKI